MFRPGFSLRACSVRGSPDDPIQPLGAPGKACKVSLHAERFT